MASVRSVRALAELDYVEFTKRLEEFPAGTRGTVVSARPDLDGFTVEVTDDAGRTLGLGARRRRVGRNQSATPTTVLSDVGGRAGPTAESVVFVVSRHLLATPRLLTGANVELPPSAPKRRSGSVDAGQGVFRWRKREPTSESGL